MPSAVLSPHIGDLRARVRLEALVSTADSHGGTVSTWTLIATVAAAVWPVSGREAVLAGQMTAVSTAVVWIRWRTDLSVKDRVVFGARVLQIENIDDPDGRRTWLRLMCSEVEA
jgi:SPP1 family predicted phage head-tail adaptor